MRIVVSNLNIMTTAKHLSGLFFEFGRVAGQLGGRSHMETTSGRNGTPTNVSTMEESGDAIV